MIGDNPDLDYHIGKIVYDGTSYQVFLDGNLVYTSVPTNTVTGLWFAHPFVSVTAPWTGFKLDYIKVIQL